MKNKKIMRFIFTCLLFAVMFFGTDKVYAYVNGEICQGDSEPHPGYHWIQVDGDCIQAYCADQTRSDPVDGQKFEKIGLYKLFTSWNIGTSSSKLSQTKAEQLVLKLGGAKYYFENIATFSKFSYNYKTKLRFAQVAMWDIMNEFYGENIWNTTVDNYYIGEDIRGYFKEAYSDFGTWYKDNKDFLTVTGTAWVLIGGGGQPLLQLEVEYNPVTTDFGVDIACENCSSKIADSKAIVIQDTDDWDGILKSDSSSVEKTCGNSNIKTYFKREAGVYCREEFYIYYPNAKNRIEIQLGRYFIVNEENVPATAVDIPIWKPIKVKKIKQCKATDDTKLKNFKTKSDKDFFTCGGNVQLKYESADPYNRTITLTGHYVSGKSSISAGLLTQEAVFAYTLPNGTYQLVRREDGVSVDKNSSVKDLSKYIDLGISNLPVPFKNNTSSVQVKLYYSLPGSSLLKGLTGSNVCTDSYSNISKAFDVENNKVTDKLTCKNNKNRIYSPYKNNQTPWKTSCAKLYNVKKAEFDETGKYVGKLKGNIKNTAYEACVNERANGENNIGKCFTSDNDYLCTINVGCVCNQVTAGKKVNDKCDFSKLEWDSKLKKCVGKQKKSCSKEAGRYYDNDGKETTREVYIKQCCKSAKEADDLGVDWDSEHNVCCDDDKIYSSEDKKCCPPNEYDDETGRCSGKPPLCDAEHIKDYPGMVIIDGACCEESSVITVNNKKACCTIDTYSKLGLDWDKVNQKCCPLGYEFSEDTQKCMPGDGICGNLNCGDKPCCKDGESYYCGWITENGEKVCSGKPDVPFDELVYRNINVNAAFIDEDGEFRSRTGLNWCNTVTVGNKGSLANCETRPDKNAVIQKVISNGNSTDKEKAAYVVKLDANAIDEIRNYNKENEYSDFTLKCEKGFCYSSFLKKYSQYVSGNCKNEASSYYKYATCNSK